ncbi:PAN domain-containing protein [Aphelenchoides avenae]|nr:PAN domain-containing protein [Aphelenchus avenae]
MDSKSAQMEKVEDFDVMPVNFYENICATIPLGADAVVVEAKFDGYKGGEGVVKFAQKRDRTLQMLILLDGVKAAARLDVLYRRENVKDCFKLKREELKSMEKVADVETDSNGMAILSVATLIAFFSLSAFNMEFV